MVEQVRRTFHSRGKMQIKGGDGDGVRVDSRGRLMGNAESFEWKDA